MKQVITLIKEYYEISLHIVYFCECKCTKGILSEISEMYRDKYRIVNSVSRYVSYRETSILLQP